MTKILNNANRIRGTIEVLGDKSISHRAVMFGAIATGKTEITGFLKGEDCISTINCFRDMGVKIEEQDKAIIVNGRGLRGLSRPNNVLDVGNSGTTIRLISGILAGQNFTSNLTGDASIKKRPMKRIIDPLTQMGARVESNDFLAPLKIEGANLKAISYDMPVASAQVKSAIILAGLYANGVTVIREKMNTRNHTELMLKSLGADINTENNNIIVKPVDSLIAKNIDICGDISSASYFIVACLITKNSHIIIKNVGANPTRTGFLDVLIEMGADISFNNNRIVCSENVCDIEVKYSKLKACNISSTIIPRMIDEIPLFALVASLANGTSVVKDAEELKFKESNRISTISSELNKIGANIKETDDGMIIEGDCNLIGGECDSHNDHRIAMCVAIASLVCDDYVKLSNAKCVDISFPTFFDILEELKN